MFDVWYWAILEKNKEGRYFPHVPDLPGATAAGETEREVLESIAEIAADHVRDLVEDGHEVPKARSNDEIERDPDVSEVGRVAIPVDVPGRSVKVSLSIDEALLKRVDRAANKAGMTRSGYFAAAVEARMVRVAVDNGSVLGGIVTAAGAGVGKGGSPMMGLLRSPKGEWP
jgi:predicted RNase H-like HicB family nuclease